MEKEAIDHILADAGNNGWVWVVENYARYGKSQYEIIQLWRLKGDFTPGQPLDGSTRRAS